MVKDASFPVPVIQLSSARVFKTERPGARAVKVGNDKEQLFQLLTFTHGHYYFLLYLMIGRVFKRQKRLEEVLVVNDHDHIFLSFPLHVTRDR